MTVKDCPQTLIMGNPGVITLQVIASGLDTTMANLMKGL